MPQRWGSRLSPSKSRARSVCTRHVGNSDSSSTDVSAVCSSRCKSSCTRDVPSGGMPRVGSTGPEGHSCRPHGGGCAAPGTGILQMVCVMFLFEKQKRWVKFKVAPGARVCRLRKVSRNNSKKSTTYILYQRFQTRLQFNWQFAVRNSKSKW